MDFKLKGKVALVTGAGSQIGFGKEIALTLAREGCEAIGITDINLDDAKLTAEAVKAAGAKSIAVRADVTNPEDVGAMVKEIADEFGKIDILCNVAGAILGGGPLEEQSKELWEKEVALNLFGPMIVCQAVIPYMKKQGGGSIVNISSSSSKMYSLGVMAYASAKGAVDTFSKQLATVEAGNNIRVNCVAPGPSPTNFIKAQDKEAVMEVLKKEIPLGRATTPQDIAVATVFFASELSADISGQVLHVSGASVM